MDIRYSKYELPFCEMESLWVCTNVFQEVNNNMKAKICERANPPIHEDTHCLLSCEIISRGKNLLLGILIIESGCSLMLLKICSIFVHVSNNILK